MDDAHTCKRCGKPKARDDLMGLCEKCLLAEGLGKVADATASGSQVTFAPPNISEMAPLFPQLEILASLGCGGMGAVYKARQKNLDRFVALKILPPDIGDDPAFAARFTREAKALAKLNHPNIVTIHDSGRAGDLFYFVMEYVDGVDLGQLLRHRRVSPREALMIVPQICDALQYAHDNGIVHRDIKPENILLDRLGRVKVADFGLAKLVGTAAAGEGDSPLPSGRPSADNLTVGDLMGTPQYMAPEQVCSPAEVDHRADIYSLGVVFYQMLTGELPKSDCVPPSKKVALDVRLDEVVLRALEQQPERRYQHVRDVKTQVENIVRTGADAKAGAVKASGWWGGAQALAQRTHMNVLPVAVLFFLICVGLVFLLASSAGVVGRAATLFRGGRPGGGRLYRVSSLPVAWFLGNGLSEYGTALCPGRNVVSWIDSYKRLNLEPSTGAVAAAALPLCSRTLVSGPDPTGMVYIPEGNFQMGDSFAEGRASERLVRTMYVPAFFMDKSGVTLAKWREVLDWSTNGCGYAYDNAGYGKADNHPVHSVNWYDAVKWCNARSEKEGRPPCYFTDAALTLVYRNGNIAPYVNWDAPGYRLPTEAEREKAARGGLSGRRFPWGDTISHAQANYISLWTNGVPVYPYDVNPTSGPPPLYATGFRPHTSPAGAFPPNGYGLYDMAGNQWEWCWDWAENNDASQSWKPTGPETGTRRVARGGCWYFYANGCQVFYHPSNFPQFNGGFGFRAVLSLGQQ